MESTSKKISQINKLNRYIVNEYFDQFLLVDKTLSETLSKWDLTNFLAELPEKWQLSYYAHLNGKIVGYIICSKKECSIHIHRLAVCKKFQKMNVGYSLIKALEDHVDLNKKITLKVKKVNLAAIKFYEKSGFIRYGEEDCNYLYEKSSW